MRRLEPRPKEKRRVSIPEELRHALLEAIEVVRTAKRDGYALDFDDAIQVGGDLCGGRIGDKRRPYVFTYYPSDDPDRGRWFLALHPLEMRELVDGVMVDLAMWCCTGPECRCKFRDESETCFYCDYVDDDRPA